MKKIVQARNILSLVYSIAIVFVSYSIVYAQGFVTNPVESIDSPGGLQNPLAKGGINTIAEFFEMLLRIFILLAYPVIVLFMVYAGFLFITAQGSTEKLTLAKKIFLWTLIGALIVLGAQALLIAIRGTVTEIIQGRAPIELSRPLAEENPMNIERRV